MARKQKAATRASSSKTASVPSKSSTSRPPSKQVAPKSILKKPAAAPSPPPVQTPTSPSGAASREERNRALAYHHATLIQQRKDVELTILTSIEELIDSPSKSTTDPARPTPADQSSALEQLYPFRPSDFDSLIEERNINHKCGYVLCPRKNRKQDDRGTYRIQYGVNGASGVAGFRVANKIDLEKWCSDECGRRALWLRVQMSETPAWERVSGEGAMLELYKEEGIEHNQTSAKSAENVEEVDGLTNNLNQLALERGDKNANSFRGKSFTIAVREKPTSGANAKPPEPGGNPMAIDGYVPKTQKEKSRQVQFDEDSDEDDEDDENDESDDDSEDEDDVMDTI